MIERLTIQNFKSLRQVELNLGRLNFLIGPNASGKSNLLDALVLLKLLARGNSVPEALGFVRGGLANALFRSSSHQESYKSCLHIDYASDGEAMHYGFCFDSQGAVLSEILSKKSEKLFTYDGTDGYFVKTNGSLVATYPNPFFGSQMIHSAILGMANAQKEIIEEWCKRFSSTQLLSLDPKTLRDYGPPIPVLRMAEDGKGFASIVQAICQDARTKQAYLSWLQEMRPAEVDDVGIKPGAQGEPMFCVIENGETRLAPVLSEGTLRFAAVAAAFFQPELPPLLALEEVDNGIHPSRLRLLVELLRSQAALGKTQILATTHSPLVLAWLKPEEYQHVFCFKRDTATGETIVKPLCELPGFTEIIQQQSVMDLLIEGWMESVL